MCVKSNVYLQIKCLIHNSFYILTILLIYLKKDREKKLEKSINMLSLKIL